MSALPSTFEIRVLPLSDWHVGTGRGRVGSVDATVRKDRDGLPFVPAKSLIGVLRDACETVAAALDRDLSAAGRADPTGRPVSPGHPPTAGSWFEWVDFLFGTQRSEGWEPAAPQTNATERNSTDQDTGRDSRPRAAALRLAPARYPDRLRTALRDKPDLVQATVLHRPGVCLDPRTGTAREKFLRLEERAVRGETLVTRAEVIGVGEVLPEPAELLLRAGARLVEGLGGKRHRGSGRVAVLLPGVEAPAVPGADGKPGADSADGVPDADGRPGGVPESEVPEGEPDRARPGEVPADTRLADLLGDDRLLADPRVPPEPLGPPEPLPPRTLAGPRHTLRLTVKVHTPVSVGDRQLGNIHTTRDEVPGTLLLPALHRRLHRDGGLGLGDLRIGPLVPAVPASGTAAIPTHVPAWTAPRTWMRSDKGRGPQVINAALQAPDPALRAKPATGRIARSGDDTWQAVRVSKEISTHAVIHDVARRPLESSGGGLFSREGIAAGTVLVADVVLPVDARLDLLPGQELRLGRSSKDDHGLVEVLSVHEVPPPPRRAVGEDGLLHVWCLTDVLLRNACLVPDPTGDGLARELGAALGCELEPVRSEQDPARPGRTVPEVRGTVASAARREGFAVRWGRHHASKAALAAGSVVTLRFVGQDRPSPDLVAAVERDGIGERVTEGFGRLLMDPPELLCAKPRLRTTRPPERENPEREDPEERACESPEPAGGAPGAWPSDRAHPIELRAWRRAVLGQACAVALDPQERQKVLPVTGSLSRSQLGSLRAQVEGLGCEGGRGPVREWFRTTRSIPSRARPWGDALQAMENLLLGDPELRWQHLGLGGPRQNMVLEPGREDVVRTELAHEALAVLLREVLRHVHAEHEDPRDATRTSDPDAVRNGPDHEDSASTRGRQEEGA
ncbi:MAG: CRISPR-associated protein Csx10 [Actinomycetota bacterium]|nr:CRISPR-associated protein Csx10 [Actinomycetota bacterium]